MGARRDRIARPTSIIHTAQPRGTSTLRTSKPSSVMNTDPMISTATNALTKTSDQRCMPARTTSTLATTSQRALALGAEVTRAARSAGAASNIAGTANTSATAAERIAARSAAATAQQVESDG